MDMVIYKSTSPVLYYVTLAAFISVFVAMMGSFLVWGFFVFSPVSAARSGDKEDYSRRLEKRKRHIKISAYCCLASVGVPVTVGFMFVVVEIIGRMLGVL